ncbi:MAG: hypothetical protein GY730_01440 [bacterium]|nr:hypothetical protein [bacterium]
MQKIYKSTIFLLTLHILTLPCFSSDKLILYPGNPSFLKYSYKNRNIINKKIRLTNMPYGIVADSIYIIKPKFKSWSYSYDLNNINDFFNKIRGQSVRVNKSKNSSVLNLLYQDNDYQILGKAKNRDLIINSKKQNLYLKNKNISIKPVLTLLLNKPEKKRADVILSCFIDTMSSDINYKGTINDRKNLLSLTPYVWITNNSGMEFKNIKIEVTGGKPQIIPYIHQQDSSHHLYARQAAAHQNKAVKEDEYYSYKTSGSHTLKNGAVTVLPLFRTLDLKTEKIYRYTAPALPWHIKDQSKKTQLDIVLRFKNLSQKPLPAGKLSIYSTNGIFLGEDIISSISHNETKEIIYGKKFDLKGKKFCMGITENPDNQLRNSKIIESDFIITIENYSDKFITAEIVDLLPDKDWQIKTISSPYTLVSAGKIRMNLKLGPNTDHQIKYTATKRVFHK